MVLISLLATAVLIATVTLITSCIRKKRAGKALLSFPCPCSLVSQHPESRDGLFRSIIVQEGNATELRVICNMCTKLLRRESGSSHFFKWKNRSVVLCSREILFFVAGKEMDFDRHPAFRKGVLQVRDHLKSLILGALFDVCYAAMLALCSPLKGIAKYTVPLILQW